MSCRCQAFVLDSVTRRYRKCKNKQIKIAGVDHCRIHCPSPANIQAVFRGFLCRRRLKVFKELPSDVWQLVLYHTRFEHNVINKYVPSLIDIYRKRINKRRQGYEGIPAILRDSMEYRRNQLKISELIDFLPTREGWRERLKAPKQRTLDDLLPGYRVEIMSSSGE